MDIVQIKDLHLQFGGLVAVNNLSFTIPDNTVMSVIGPNGAGKTSLFNMITGFYQPTRGQIIFNGTNIVGKKPSQITGLGMARTFQNLRVFPNLSVLENVMSGMHSRTKQGIFGALFRTPAQRREEELIRSVAEECIQFVGMEHYMHRTAKNLPYGAQRYLEIARALAIQPRIVFLDEPAAGFTYNEKLDLINLIGRIRDKYRIPVVLIEHDMGLINKVSEKIIVLNYGEKLAEGTPDEVLNNPLVIEAYLGKEEEDEII
ncbi:ABC transporter ATP-binding protein [Aneurinibacillus tyrosinisolvens]|uniref:ABC transporter ATP-binding protein n=1 Tax=Aneurinibacillus tyrosinisolvens TaxID=1443435 RepID=UPI00063F89A8|nr:ABC transporter ATP-binding protein [Aneurinibacillus tyrosinisolvens]